MTFNSLGLDTNKTKDYQTLIKLRSKIMEVMDINDMKHKTDIDFIDVVLKDYNFYTQNM